MGTGTSRGIRRAPIAVLISLALAAAAVALPSGGALASSIKGDRQQMKTIEQEIAAQGVLIQKIVIRYDQAQNHEAYLTKKLAKTEQTLAAEQAAGVKAKNRLREAAVVAYVTGGAPSSLLTLLSTSGTTSSQMAVYENVAAGHLSAAVANYVTVEHHIQVSEAALRSEKATEAATMRRVNHENTAATAAMKKDEKLLQSVKGNLKHLLAVQAAERRAAARRREQELARQRAAATAAAAAAAAAPPVVATTTPPTTTPPTTQAPSGGGSPAPTPPPPPPPPPSSPPPSGGGGGSSGYANPLAGVNGLSPERIDQGVDYSGFGPIVAIGSGVVLSTYNGGWPGGTFITYRLTSGPGAGLVVYAAEDIQPKVQVGQTVSAGTVIGTVYEGPDGIETGWASGGTGATMAMVNGQFSGANSTAFGANFSNLLVSVGAPPGILQNTPPTGSLPSGWPTW